jgi:dihydroflavonol-4-reductase
MRALITGASGFVGTWLTRRLVDEGIRVRVLARKPTGDFPGIESEVIGDVCDADSLFQATRDVDIVYHLAAVIAYSRALRPQMERVNVSGTRNLIEAVMKNQVPRLLHMSSVSAIGASFDGVPLNEQSPFNLSRLNLGYFESKRAAEQLVMQAVQERGLNAVVVNPSNIYGAGDAAKGSRKMQIKVAQGRLPIFTGGGVSVIGIHELIDAVVKAARIGQKGERYILSGENITIERLFKDIANAAGVRPPHLRLPNWLAHSLGALGDFSEMCGRPTSLTSEMAWTSTLFHWFDCSKAQRVLGLKIRPAAECIEDSVRWMKDHKILINDGH